jgi:diphthamide biosynthesis methyltransferase
MTKLIGLGKWDEEEITKKLRAEALVKCDEAVREYAECCRSHWFVWKCKSLAHKMNDCVRQ